MIGFGNINPLLVTFGSAELLEISLSNQSVDVPLSNIELAVFSQRDCSNSCPLDSISRIKSNLGALTHTQSVSHQHL